MSRYFSRLAQRSGMRMKGEYIKPLSMNVGLRNQSQGGRPPSSETLEESTYVDTITRQTSEGLTNTDTVSLPKASATDVAEKNTSYTETTDTNSNTPLQSNTPSPSPTEATSIQSLASDRKVESQSSATTQDKQQDVKESAQQPITESLNHSVSLNEPYSARQATFESVVQKSQKAMLMHSNDATAEISHHAQVTDNPSSGSEYPVEKAAKLSVKANTTAAATDIPNAEKTVLNHSNEVLQTQEPVEKHNLNLKNNTSPVQQERSDIHSPTKSEHVDQQKTLIQSIEKVAASRGQTSDEQKSGTQIRDEQTSEVAQASNTPQYQNVVVTIGNIDIRIHSATPATKASAPVKQNAEKPSTNSANTLKLNRYYLRGL